MSDAGFARSDKSALENGVNVASISADSSGSDLGRLESQTNVEQKGELTSCDCPEVPDPDLPRNWSQRRKWTTLLSASAFGFISPIASSILAPALPAIGEDLAIANQITLQMVLSVFVLAYAIGPLFLGPLSEVYGRVPVMQWSSAMFLIFNLACGFAQSYEQIIAFRFLAGLGGSAPLTLNGGITTDLFVQSERGVAVRIYTMAPLLAPAVGPIIGGIITQRTTWRWIFWALSIANALVQICALFTFRESWLPKVLKSRAQKMQAKTSDPCAEKSLASASQDLAQNLSRAVRMLLTQPIIIVVAIYVAYLFGLSYLMLSTFAELYTSPRYYDQSVQNASFHYVALAGGYLVGTQGTAYLDDWLYQWLNIRYDMESVPELHLPAMVPSTILLPAGLLMYGWCAESRLHWILPDIGAFITCAALNSAYHCISRYTIDAYSKYAASAVAATTTLRNIAGFGFPLFAPAMYDSLNYGWGNSLLALVAICVGVPAPWLFWFYGPAMRAKSRYAAD